MYKLSLTCLAAGALGVAALTPASALVPVQSGIAAAASDIDSTIAVKKGAKKRPHGWSQGRNATLRVHWRHRKQGGGHRSCRLDCIGGGKLALLADSKTFNQVRVEDNVFELATAMQTLFVSASQLELLAEDQKGLSRGLKAVHSRQSRAQRHGMPPAVRKLCFNCRMAA